MNRSISLEYFLKLNDNSHNIQYWSFGDQNSINLSTCQGCNGVFPLASFNHISREVIDLEKSIKFYSYILGFQEIPRPNLDCKGCWLFGYGVSVHLIVTNCLEKRKQVLFNRKEHFTTSLPTVDHIAFVTNDTSFVENLLIREKVFYRRFDPEGTNITQLFIFDPDGNVIEVSSCGIPIGETKCQDHKVGSDIGAIAPFLPALLPPLNSVDNCCESEEGISPFSIKDIDEDQSVDTELLFPMQYRYSHDSCEDTIVSTRDTIEFIRNSYESVSNCDEKEELNDSCALEF